MKIVAIIKINKILMMTQTITMATMGIITMMMAIF
jgi:hypothetical protein